MKTFSALSILLSAFVCSSIVCKGQNPLVKEWDYRFGGVNDDYFTCFQQTKDGGFVLGGYSSSGIGGDKTELSWGGTDYWIVKIDSLGIKQWDKDFGGTNDDNLYSLQQTFDGGYILGGYSSSGIGGNKTQVSWGDEDYWIVKIDSFGIKQWDKDFGGTSHDYLISLQQTIDRGYILGGASTSDSSGDKTKASWGDDDYWIVKIDSLGNKQWDKDFGGTNNDAFLSLQQTADMGYILGGESGSGIDGDKTQSTWGGYDYWIIKTDSLGNKHWDKDFGGTAYDEFRSIKQTMDDGYILGGRSYSDVGGDKTQPSWGGVGDYWVVKVNSLGIKQWDKDFGGTDAEELWEVLPTADGGYIFSGDSYSPVSGDKTESNLGAEQTWVLKTDSLGNNQWDKTVLTSGHDETGLVIQTKNGCYAIANLSDGGIGAEKSQAAWNSSHDYWIIKFCDTTIATSVNSTSFSNSNISISPNPFTTSTTITLTNYIAPFNLQLFDELGREALLHYHTTQQGNNTILTVDRGELQNGMYFLSITSKEKREVVKLMVE